MDRLLWYVFAGSRGGPTRIRIIQALLEAPLNTNQLANALGMDYKTIEYQLRVLAKHVLVVRHDQGYGRPWQVSKNLAAAMEEFQAIAAKAAPKHAASLGKGTNTTEGE